MFRPVATRPRTKELALDISSANWSSLEPFAYGGSPMIVEERIYTFHLGKVPKYARLMESEGIAIQEPILEGCLVIFQLS
jgi:hypothetical protein